MSIPEAQLDAWSKQGSVAQSAATYGSIKKVLDSYLAPYYKRDCTSFLQGSYANDTNIVGRESDVDIVLRSSAAYYYDTDWIDDAAKLRFERNKTPAGYTFVDFKAEAFHWLRSSYGARVTFGNKAISVEGEGARRDADVIPCFQYRKYTKYNSAYDSSFIEGIFFFANDGAKVINYPKQHLENCTKKHQATNGYFRSMVRVLKNMRNNADGQKILEEGRTVVLYRRATPQRAKQLFRQWVWKYFCTND